MMCKTSVLLREKSTYIFYLCPRYFFLQAPVLYRMKLYPVFSVCMGITELFKSKRGHTITFCQTGKTAML